MIILIVVITKEVIVFFFKVSAIAWVTHVNPDGSEGGRVAESAVVGNNVTIAKTARVFAGAIVPDNAVLNLGVFYTSEGILHFE